MCSFVDRHGQLLFVQSDSAAGGRLRSAGPPRARADGAASLLSAASQWRRRGPQSGLLSKCPVPLVRCRWPVPVIHAVQISVLAESASLLGSDHRAISDVASSRGVSDKAMPPRANRLSAAAA